MTFQYPPCGSRRCNPWLLVPCVRTNRAFSTLHAGRDAATPDFCALCPIRKTFSTLHAGRDAATHPEDACLCCGINFQYPPCGSRRCNCFHRRCLWRFYHLSVPSMRVETLQLALLLVSVNCSKLSVPSMRVETLQPDAAYSNGYGGIGLSVPSMRVETLQPPVS